MIGGWWQWCCRITVSYTHATPFRVSGSPFQHHSPEQSKFIIIGIFIVIIIQIQYSLRSGGEFEQSVLIRRSSPTPTPKPSQAHNLMDFSINCSKIHSPQAQSNNNVPIWDSEDAERGFAPACNGIEPS